MTDETRRAELAALIETGWTNTPFSRCSYCGKDWDGGEGHDHPDREWDDLVMENTGGTIKFDSEKAADAVLAYVADAVAQAEQAKAQLDRITRYQAMDWKARDAMIEGLKADVARAGRAGRELRDAVGDYLAPHESRSHPGSGGDPDAAQRLQRVRDAYAEVVRRESEDSAERVAHQQAEDAAFDEALRRESTGDGKMMLCSFCNERVDPEGHRWECPRREPAP